MGRLVDVLHDEQTEKVVHAVDGIDSNRRPKSRDGIVGSLPCITNLASSRMKATRCQRSRDLFSDEA